MARSTSSAATPGPLASGSPPPVHVLESTECHTMPGASLRRYLMMKVHEDIEDFARRSVDCPLHTIRIVGMHDRSAGVSSKEKRDKRANWMRPTSSGITSESTENPESVNSRHVLEIRVFPGRDYVYHYAAIVSNWLVHFQGPNNVAVRCASLPSADDCRAAVIAAVHLDRVPVRSATVVLGIVDRLVAGVLKCGGCSGFDEWHDAGDAEWASGCIGRSRVVFLCVRFSIWSDIGGCLVEALADRGCTDVVYAGKVGALVPEWMPNETLVTGCESIVASPESPQGWRRLRWHGRLQKSLAELSGKRYAGVCLESCIHYNSPSILLEDKKWLANKAKHTRAHIVDPEIGSMALAAVASNIDFSYLHIVSNNLKVTHAADLSNERESGTPEKRAHVYDTLGHLLVTAIQRCDD